MEILTYIGLALALLGGLMAAGKSELGEPLLLLGIAIATWAWIVGSVRRHLALLERQTKLLRDMKAALERGFPPAATAAAPAEAASDGE